MVLTSLRPARCASRSTAAWSPRTSASPARASPMRNFRQAHAAGILINLQMFPPKSMYSRDPSTGGRRCTRGDPGQPAVRVESLRHEDERRRTPVRHRCERVPEMLERIRDCGLVFEGFHLFAGSQNLRAEAIIEAQTRSYGLALGWLDRCRARQSCSISMVSAFRTRSATSPWITGTISDNLAVLVDRARADIPSTHLAIELGRYLVGEAGIYVARVIDRKISHDQVFLIVDGGMRHHLAASGNLGQVMRRNYPIAVNRSTSDKEIASISGPLCTPLDLLADRAELDVAEPGDLVVVFQSGAYGRSASPRGFLSHPDVIEALV